RATVSATATARPAPRTTSPRTSALPDLSSPAPSRTPAAASPAPSASAPHTVAATGTVIRIGTWSARVVRGGQDAVDACRDAVQWSGPDLGTENGYAMRTVVLVGHDYCGGFGRFAGLPVGTVVTVETPRSTYTYKVYANYLTPGRGTPAHGLFWGDLTLQSCVGPDTGFSYLVRD
ncbi:hypothetical protein J0695_14545, partial [Streptomyces beijiangensis]|nr:hypothetical protein [Streptomyces beijiangensis]